MDLTKILNALQDASCALDNDLVSVALAVASSGISATEITGGEIAISGFKMSLEIRKHPH